MFLVYLVFLHFIADFILQSREMGQKKSKELKWWSLHVGIQFLVFLFGIWIFKGPDYALVFALWNALFHGMVDAVIWNLYGISVFYREYKGNIHPSGSVADEIHKEEYKNKLKKNWKYWEDHLFYTTIGFDQLLHIATILLLVENL